VRAAVYYDAGDIRVEDVPDPVPAPGELLLEVHAVGICGTDVSEYVHGPVQFPIRSRHPVTGHQGPMIPGHELSGRVVAVGDGVRGFRPGAVVASGAGISCGECFQCAGGRTNLCLRYATVGLQRDGGLAQLCAVPAATCVDVAPYGLDEEVAALAQPMAIAVHALRRGRLRPGDDALVLGVGGIGAFLVFAAAELGARVAVVDVAPERLALARALGAADAIEAVPDGGLGEVLRERGLRPWVVYEVVGTESTLLDALDATSPGGRLVLVGLHGRPRTLDLRRVTLSEVELVGTMAHAVGVDLPEALRLLAARKSRWSDVAPAVLPLTELVSGGIVPMAERRSSRVKTLIDPWAATARSR
jgi:(R,R)-butanediol dehydrogenase/meso-butanediol dehydrogenase/diacetyl reductase